MAVPLYKITFAGQLLPGVDQATAIRDVAALFEASEEAVVVLFEGRKLALKRHLSVEDTHKFVPMLEKAGIQTQVESDTPFDRADAQILAGGATYDDVEYSPWTAPQSAAQIEPTRAPARPALAWLDGRLNRINFAAWSLLIGMITGIVGSRIIVAFPDSPIASAASLAIPILYLLATLRVGVKRLHDINWPGWLIVLLVLPFANYLFALLLTFMPGTPGDNRFGPQPPPASMMAKVFVALIGGLMVLTLGVLVWYFSRLGA